MLLTVQNNKTLEQCNVCKKILNQGDNVVYDFLKGVGHEFSHVECYGKPKNTEEIEVVKKGDLEIVQVVNLGSCKTVIDLDNVPKKVHVPTVVDMEI
jgi:hypothetical protein